MQRIESNVAANIADVKRPMHTEVDRRASKEALDVQEVQEDVTKEVSHSEARAAAQSVQKVLEVASSGRLDFGIEERTDELFLVIRESGSGEVIKQIPSKDLVDLQSRLQAIVGVVLNETA